MAGAADREIDLMVRCAERYDLQRLTQAQVGRVETGELRDSLIGDPAVQPAVKLWDRLDLALGICSRGSLTSRA